MKTRHMKHLFALAAFTFAGAACAQGTESPVPVRTEGLPPHDAMKVQEKAQQGTTALRQYINNTRMVRELDFWSIVKSDEPIATAKEDKSGTNEMLAAGNEEPRK